MASEARPQPEGELPDAPPPDAAADDAQQPPVKRSWRRKYRKMRAKFEDTMVESNNLIKGEFKAMAISRRLQEQNDQILELLLDLNDSPRLPAHLRFDLRTLAESDANHPEAVLRVDPDTVQRKLQELRNDLANSVISAEEYAQRADQLHNAPPVPPLRSLARLEGTVPHTTEVPDPLPEGLLLGEDAPGYMSPAHEEEYLLATDMALADPAYDPNAHDGRPLRTATTANPMPSEKDLTLRNPDSVYNWLRKHQPQVFLQDKEHPENMSEKSSARPANAPGRGKRPSAVSGTPGPRTEDAAEEEVGFIPESGTGSVKGRKLKDADDSAYRPKGGSSRSGKRKREDGDQPTKGRKKNRASGGMTAN
ncbi:hypothetical protein P154DRAFT_543726 [Amniculicola lignicola CBS 123094]|uniref:IEC3 subunit of the Ino80 complex, chromatin re-modelling-domain-containing protein n=1 Tax=Amniculicola lignicola CBS 123094 TaxID=1392246 RepID=A0A6A5WQ71_9PLEO|nr:hypothetical protein P154DRAFT_543726 [Amniculicola lignicola CBS 123094]